MLLPGGHRGENTVKHVLNRQLEETERGTLVQEAGTHNNLSVINKISYRTGWGRKLKVTGRAKHLLARWDEGSYSPVDSVEVGQEASWSYFMPELLVTYTLTPKTRIEFGQHGLFVPFLAIPLPRPALRRQQLPVERVDPAVHHERWSTSATAWSPASAFAGSAATMSPRRSGTTAS